MHAAQTAPRPSAHAHARRALALTNKRVLFLVSPATICIPGDGLDKERLKALGMGAFASYGFISNLNYGTALGISWLAFVKKYGVAPTAPGQWGTFLAFYAGECLCGMRLSLSYSITSHHHSCCIACMESPPCLPLFYTHAHTPASQPAHPPTRSAAVLSSPCYCCHAAALAGLWAVQNFARPLRISLALALAPAFDAAITRLGAALRVDKRWAFGIFLLCMGLLTSATLFGTIWALGGFPPNPAGIAT